MFIFEISTNYFIFSLPWAQGERETGCILRRSKILVKFTEIVRRSVETFQPPRTFCDPNNKDQFLA